MPEMDNNTYNISPLFTILNEYNVNVPTYGFYKFLENFGVLNSLYIIEFLYSADINGELLRRLIRVRSKNSHWEDLLICFRDYKRELTYPLINLFQISGLERCSSLNRNNANIELIKNQVIKNTKLEVESKDSEFSEESKKNLQRKNDLIVQNMRESNIALYSSIVFKYSKELYLSTYYHATVSLANNEIKNYQIKISSSFNFGNETIFVGVIEELSLKFNVSLKENGFVLTADWTIFDTKEGKIIVLGIYENEDSYNPIVVGFLKSIVFPKAILYYKQFRI